jgi:hypothetical protein
MFRTPRIRRAGVLAVLALAATAASAGAASAATPLPPLPGDLFRPNLVVTSPAPGWFTVTNTGLLPSGAFAIGIHRVGLKPIGVTPQASLAHGQSVTRFIGNDCSGTFPPPALQVIADVYHQVTERSETDNALVVYPSHNC